MEEGLLTHQRVQPGHHCVHLHGEKVPEIVWRHHLKGAARVAEWWWVGRIWVWGSVADVSAPLHTVQEQRRIMAMSGVRWEHPGVMPDGWDGVSKCHRTRTDGCGHAVLPMRQRQGEGD